MPIAPKSETPTQREARLKRQRAYEARRKAADPEKWKAACCAASAKYAAANKKKVAETSRKWRDANRAKFNEGRRRWRENNVLSVLVRDAKARAKKRGIEFSITASDIPEMGTHCPIFGTPYSRPSDKIRIFAPSIDRIDPLLGYVKGNVWIISYRANLIKNDGTAEEHEKIAEAMRAKQRSSNVE